LIKDLESCRWLEGEPRRMDKSDPDLTHCVDSLRYVCWNLVEQSQDVRSFNLQEIKTYVPNDHYRSRKEIFAGGR